MTNSVFSMSMDLDISSFEKKLNQVDKSLDTTQTKLEKARDTLKDNAVNDPNGYVANTDAFNLFSSVRQSIVDLKNEFTSQSNNATNFFGDLVAPLKEAYSLLSKINAMNNTASGLNGAVYPETMNKLNLYQARLRMITDEMKTYQATMAQLDQTSQTFLNNNGAGFARQVKTAVRSIGDQTGVKGSLEATVASILTNDVIKKSLSDYGVQDKVQQQALIKAAVIAASERSDRRSHGMYLDKKLITNYDRPAFIQERLPEKFRTSFLERAQAPKGERRLQNTPAEIAQTYENIRKSVTKGNSLAYKFAEQAKLFRYGDSGKLNWLRDEEVTDDMLNYFQSLAVLEARESLESYKMWQKSIENREDRASLMSKETKNFGLAKSVMDLDTRKHIFPYSKAKRSIRNVTNSAYTGYETKIPKLNIPEMIQIPRVTIGKNGMFANIETEDTDTAVNYNWNRNGIRETERDQQITMGRNPVLDRLMNLKRTGSPKYRAQIKGEPERIFTNRGLGYGRDANGQQIEWFPIVMQMSMLDLFKKDKSGKVQFDIDGKSPLFNEDKTIDYNGKTYTQEQFANMVAEQRIPINLKFNGKYKSGKEITRTLPYVSMAMDGTGGQARFLMIQQRDAEEMARQDRERGIPLMGNFYNEMALVNGRQRIIGKDGKILQDDDQFGAMRRYYDASRKNFSHSIPIEEVGGKTPDKVSLVNFEAMYDYWKTPKSERFDGGVFIMPEVFDKDFQGRMGAGKFMAQRGNYKKFLEDAGATYSDLAGTNYAYMPALGTSAKEYGQYLQYLRDFTELVNVKDKNGNVIRQQRQLLPNFDTLAVSERIPGVTDWKSFSEWRDAKFTNALDPKATMLMSADTVLKNYFKTEMLTYENFKKIFPNSTPNKILNNQTSWNSGDLVKLTADEQSDYLRQIADPKYGSGLRIMKDMLNYQGAKDFVSSAMMSTMVVTPEMMAASKKNYKEALADLSNPYKVRQKLFSGDDLLSQIVKQNPEAIFSNSDVRREIESARNQLQEHMAKGELYLPNFYKNFLVTASMPSVFGGYAKDITGSKGFKLTGSAADLVLPEKTMFAPGFKHAQAMATRSPFAEGSSLLVENAAYGSFAKRYEAARRKYQLSKDSSVFNVGDFYKLNTGDFDGDFAFLLDTDSSKYGDYARETERRNDMVRGEMIELSKELERKKQRDRAYSNSPSFANNVAAYQITGRGMGQAWNAIMGARTNPDMAEQNLAKGQAEGNLIYDAWSAWVKKPDIIPEFGTASDYSNLSKHGRTLERVNDALLTAFATKDYSQLPDPSKVITPRYNDLIGLHMMAAMKDSKNVDPGSLRDLETAYNRWAQEAPIENEPQSLKALRERYVSYLRDKGTGEFQITELIPFTEEFDKLHKAAEDEVNNLKTEFERNKANMQPIEAAKREKELEELSTTVWRYGQRINEEKVYGVTDDAIARGMFKGREDLIDGFRKKDDIEYLAHIKELQEIENNRLKLGLQPTNPLMLSEEAKARMSYMAQRRLIANQFTPFNWSSASNYLPDLHLPRRVTEYNANEPDINTGIIPGKPNVPELFTNIIKRPEDKTRHDYYLGQNARNILFNETVATPTSVVGSLAHGFMEKYQETYLEYLEKNAGQHDEAAKEALKAAYKNLNDSIVRPSSNEQEIYDAAKIQFKLRQGASGKSAEDYTIEAKDGVSLTEFEKRDLSSAQGHYAELTKRQINGSTSPEALATNFLNPLLKSGRVVMIEGVSYENKNGTLRPIAQDEDAYGIRVGLSRDKTLGVGRLYMGDDGKLTPQDIEYRFTPDLIYANPDTENRNGKTTYTVADWKSSNYGIGKGRLQMAFYAHNLEELSKMYHSGARPDLERFAKYWDWDENDPNKGHSLITRTNGLNLNTGHYYTADYDQKQGEFIARKISEAYSNMIQSMGRGYIDELPDEDMKDASKLRMGKNRNVPVNAQRSVFDTSSAEIIKRYNFDPDVMTDDILSQLYAFDPDKMAEIERYASMRGGMAENVDRALNSGSSQNKEYLALKMHDLNKAVGDIGSFVAKKSETRYGFKDEYTRQIDQINKLIKLDDEEALNQYLKQEDLAPDVALMANDFMDNKISLQNFKQQIQALGIKNLDRAISASDSAMGSVFNGKGSLSEKYFSSQARIEALMSQSQLYRTIQDGIWDEKNGFKTDYEHYYSKELADKIKRNKQAIKNGQPVEAYAEDELEGNIEKGIYGIRDLTDVENLMKSASDASKRQEDAQIKIEALQQKQSEYLNKALDEAILSAKYTTKSATTGNTYTKTEDDLQVEETLNLIKSFDEKKQAIQDALDSVDNMLNATIKTKNGEEKEIKGALRSRLENFKKELEADKKAIDTEKEEQLKGIPANQAEQYALQLKQAEIDANKRRAEATGGNLSFAKTQQRMFDLEKDIKESEEKLKKADEQLRVSPNDKQLLLSRAIAQSDLDNNKLELEYLKRKTPRDTSLYFQQGLEKINEEIFGDKSGLQSLTDNLRVKKQQDNITELLSSARSAHRAGFIKDNEFNDIETRLLQARDKVKDGSWLKEQKEYDDLQKNLVYSQVTQRQEQLEHQSQMATEQRQHQYEQMQRARFGQSRSRFANAYLQQLNQKWNFDREVKDKTFYADQLENQIIPDKIKAFESAHHMKYEDYLNLSEDQKKALGADVIKDAGSIQAAQTQLSSYRAAAQDAAQQSEQMTGSTMAMSAAFQGLSQSIGMVAHRLGRQMFMKVLQETKQFIKQFDASMNEIQTITLKSDQEMATVRSETVSRALGLRTSVSNVATTEAALYRQGLSDQEVKSRTESIIKFATVTKLNVAEATKIITTALQNDLVPSANAAMDALVALGDSAATTAAEIGKGMQKAAASAKVAGVSYAELTALLTIGTSDTQLSGTQVGTALQTVFSRMRRMSVSGWTADQNGEKTTASDAEAALKSVGVDLWDNKTIGKMRTAYDVLLDLSKVWQNLSDAQKNIVMNAMAGTRQTNVFSTLMEGMSEDNGATLEKYLGLAEGSEGITQSKYEIAMQSLSAAMDELKSSWDAVVESFTSSGSITGTLDGISETLQNIANLANNGGQISVGLSAIAAGVTALLASFLPGGKILAVILGLSTFLGGVNLASLFTGSQETQEEINQKKLNDISVVSKNEEAKKKNRESLIENVEKAGKAWNETKSAENTDNLTIALNKLESAFPGVTKEIQNSTEGLNNWTKAVSAAKEKADDLTKQGMERIVNETKQYVGMNLGSDYTQYMDKKFISKEKNEKIRQDFINSVKNLPFAGVNLSTEDIMNMRPVDRALAFTTAYRNNSDFKNYADLYIDEDLKNTLGDLSNKTPWDSDEYTSLASNALEYIFNQLDIPDEWTLQSSMYDALKFKYDKGVGLKTLPKFFKNGTIDFTKLADKNVSDYEKAVVLSEAAVGSKEVLDWISKQEGGTDLLKNISYTDQTSGALKLKNNAAKNYQESLARMAEKLANEVNTDSKRQATRLFLKEQLPSVLAEDFNMMADDRFNVEKVQELFISALSEEMEINKNFFNDDGTYNQTEIQNFVNNFLDGWMENTSEFLNQQAKNVFTSQDFAYHFDENDPNTWFDDYEKAVEYALTNGIDLSAMKLANGKAAYQGVEALFNAKNLEANTNGQNSIVNQILNGTKVDIARMQEKYQNSLAGSLVGSTTGKEYENTLEKIKNGEITFEDLPINQQKILQGIKGIGVKGLSEYGGFTDLFEAYDAAGQSSILSNFIVGNAEAAAAVLADDYNAFNKILNDSEAGASTNASRADIMRAFGDIFSGENGAEKLKTFRTNELTQKAYDSWKSFFGDNADAILNAMVSPEGLTGDLLDYYNRILAEKGLTLGTGKTFTGTETAGFAQRVLSGFMSGEYADWAAAQQGITGWTTDEWSALESKYPGLKQYLEMDEDQRKSQEGQNLLRDVKIQMSVAGISDLEEANKVLEGTTSLIQNLQKGGEISIKAKLDFEQGLYNTQQQAALLESGTETEQLQAIMDITGLGKTRVQKMGINNAKNLAQQMLAERNGVTAGSLNELAKQYPEYAEMLASNYGFTKIQNIEDALAQTNNKYGNIFGEVGYDEKTGSLKFTKSKYTYIPKVVVDYFNSVNRGSYEYAGTPEEIDREDLLYGITRSYTPSELYEARKQIMEGTLTNENATDYELYSQAVNSLTENQKDYIVAQRELERIGRSNYTQEEYNEAYAKTQKAKEKAYAENKSWLLDQEEQQALENAKNNYRTDAALAAAYGQLQYELNNKAALAAEKAYTNRSQYSNVADFLTMARDLENWEEVESSQGWVELKNKFLDENGNLKSGVTLEDFYDAFSNLTMYSQGAGFTSRADYARMARAALTAEDRTALNTNGEAIKQIFGDEIFERWQKGEDFTNNKAIQRQLENYELGLEKLTRSQQMQGINRITGMSAATLRDYLGKQERENYADEVMAGFDRWDEYKAAIKTGKTNTEEFKLLQQQVENFAKNAKINFEVTGVQALEEAGKVVQGTADQVERLKKGGLIELEVLTTIRSQAFESGQQEAKLRYGTWAEQNAAAMAINKQSEEEFWATGRKESIQMAEETKEAEREQKALTYLEEYYAASTENKTDIIDNALSEGYEAVYLLGNLIGFNFNKSLLKKKTPTVAAVRERQLEENKENDLTRFYRSIAEDYFNENEYATIADFLGSTNYDKLYNSDETFKTMINAGVTDNEIVQYAKNKVTGQRGNVYRRYSKGWTDLFGGNRILSEEDLENASKAYASASPELKAYYDSFLGELPASLRNYVTENEGNAKNVVQESAQAYYETQFEGFRNGQELAQKKATFEYGTDEEQEKIASDYASQFRQMSTAEAALNAIKNGEDIPTQRSKFAQALGLDEKDIEKLGVEDLQELLSKQIVKLLEESITTMDLDLSGDNVRDKLQKVADDTTNSAHSAVSVMLEIFDKLGLDLQDVADNINGSAGTTSFSEAYSKGLDALSGRASNQRAIDFLYENREALIRGEQLDDHIEGWKDEYGDVFVNNQELFAAYELAREQEQYRPMFESMLTSLHQGGYKNYDYYNAQASAMFGDYYQNGQFNIDTSNAKNFAALLEKLRGDNETKAIFDEWTAGMSDVTGTINDLNSSDPVKVAGAIEKLNSQMSSKRAEEAVKYSKGIAGIGDIIADLGKDGTKGLQAATKLEQGLTKVVDAMKALNQASGKTGKQIKDEKGDKGKTKFSGDEVLQQISEVTGFSKDELSRYTKDQMNALVTDWMPVLAEQFDGTIQTIVSSLPNEVLAIPFDQLITFTAEGEPNLADVDAKLQGVAQTILDAIKSLAKVYGSIDLKAIWNGDKEMTVEGFFNALGGASGLNLSSAPRGASGSSSGGGGKSELDKSLEKIKHQVAEVEHQGKLLEIAYEGLDYINDFSGMQANVDAQISNQQQLASVISGSIAQLEAQRASLEAGTEDWYKATDSIMQYEEQLASVNNTINKLHSLQIKIIEERQEYQKAPQTYKGSMLEKHAQRYQLTGQFEAYESITNDEIQNYKDEIALNSQQIKEWEEMLRNTIKNSDDAEDIKKKIWDKKLESEQYENDIINAQLELSKAKVDQIAKDIENSISAEKHANEVLGIYAGMYESKEQYGIYREYLEEQAKNLDVIQAGALQTIKELTAEVEATPEDDPAREYMIQMLYDYEKTYAELQAESLRNQQSIEETFITEINKEYEQKEKTAEHESKLLSEKLKQYQKDDDFVNTQNILAETAENTGDKIAIAQAKLEEYLKLQNSGKITEGSVQWRNLQELIDDTTESIESLKNEQDDFIRQSQQLSYEHILTNFKEGNEEFVGMDQLQHERNLIGYEQTKYQNRGELTNVGKTLELDRAVIDEEVEATKNQIEALKNFKKTVENNPELYKKTTEEIRKQEEALAKLTVEQEKNTDAIKKNQEAIRQAKTKVENEADKAIRSIIQKNRSMLSATVSIQNSILDTIRNNYKEQWELEKKTIEKKKQALNEEKNLLTERLNFRKKMMDQESKDEDLAEYKRQLALISADTTRTKDANEMRRKIAEMEKEQALQDAQDIANAEIKAMDDRSKAWDDYVAVQEEDLTNLLANANNFRETLDKLLSGSFDDFVEWNLQYNKSYINATEEQRKQMEEGWDDTWYNMLGLLRTYWDEVDADMRSKEGFMALLTSTDDYNKLSETGKESYLYNMGDLYDKFVASTKEDEVVLNDQHEILNTLKDLENWTFKVRLSDEDNVYYRQIISAYEYIRNRNPADEVDLNLYENEGKNPEPPQSYAPPEPAPEPEQSSGSGTGTTSSKKPESTTYTVYGEKPNGFDSKTNKTTYIHQMYGSGYTLEAARDAKYKKGPANGWQNLYIVDPKTGEKVYKHGGYVDYTGPAWVDGTKSQPEAFLDATDTKLLRDMLDAFNYVRTTPYMTHINDNNFGNKNVSVGDINVNLYEAKLEKDADYELIAQKVGNAFTKQLQKDGFNLAQYNW